MGSIAQFRCAGSPWDFQKGKLIVSHPLIIQAHRPAAMAAPFLESEVQERWAEMYLRSRTVLEQLSKAVYA